MEDLLYNIKNLTLPELSRFWLDVNSALPGGMPPDSKVDPLVLAFGSLTAKEKHIVNRKALRLLQMLVDTTQNPPPT